MVAKVLRFVRNVSILIFLVVLGYAYYDMGDRKELITLFFDAEQYPVEMIHKNYFFYVPASFVIVLNILLAILTKTLRGIPLRLLPIAKKEYWRKEEETRLQARDIIESWLASFAIMFNGLTAWTVMHIWRMNRTLEGTASGYILFLVIGLLTLIAWSAYLPIRFRMIPTEKEEKQEEVLQN